MGIKMRKFVMLSPNFWVGHTGRDLARAGNHAQLVALYLLSNPLANYTGLYRLPLIYIANDLNMPLDNVRDALKAIEKTGFAKYDEASEYVWIVECARHQLGEDLKPADNKVKYVNKEFAAISKNCPFISAYSAKYATSLHLKPRKDMPEAVASPACEPTAAVVEEKALERATTVADAAVEPPASVVLAPVLTTREDARVKFYDALSTFWSEREQNGFETYAGNPVIKRLVSFSETTGPEEAMKVIKLALEAHDYDIIDFETYASEAIDI